MSKPFKSEFANQCYFELIEMAKDAVSDAHSVQRASDRNILDDFITVSNMRQFMIAHAWNAASDIETKFLLCEAQCLSALNEKKGDMVH
jgi:hypothetical protein